MATKSKTKNSVPRTRKTTTKKSTTKAGGVKLASYQRFSRRKTIIIIIIFVAIGIATLLYSLAATTTTIVEAESLKYNNNSKPVSTGGQIFRPMYGKSTGTGTFSLKDRISKVSVIAYANICEGSPTLEIRVDNVLIMAQDVAAITPTTYSAAANLAPGSHTISISFANDLYKKGVCDRNVYVDKVQFIGVIPDPVTSTTQAASVCAIGVHGVEYGGEAPADRANSVAKMRQTGALTARVHLVWPYVQTSRTTYDEAKLKQYDDYIDKLRAAGMHIIIVNGATPGWAADPAYPFAPQANDYANFLKTMATRYKGKVDSYQILNEVDHSWPADSGPAVYTNILKTVYPVIKQTDSKATVTMSGLSYDYTTAPAFVKGVYAAGAKPYFDQLAMHFYPQPGQDTNLYITNIRQPMVDNGDKNKLIVVTETGRPTATTSTGAVPAGSSSEADQATFMVNNYKTLLSYPYIGRTIVYYETFDHDRNGNTAQANNADPELRFGIYRRDNSAKPVLAALQAMQKNCPTVTHPDLNATLRVARNQLYELWNGSEQIYTADGAERSTLISKGYADQGLKGSTYASAVPGTTPLYRLYSAKATDHIYTTSATVRQQALNGTLPEQPGNTYVEEKSPGWVLTTPTEGARALGGTYSKANVDHMYWTYDWQKSGQNSGGYTDLGVVGYILN